MENFEKIKEATTAAFQANFEKLSVALNEVAAAGQANIEAATTSSEFVSKGLTEAGALSAAYTKSAFENGANAAKTFFAAKTPVEALEIQTNFAKAAFEAWYGEANKIAQVFTNTATEAAKPITARSNEFFAKFQAAQ
jgi:phasin family protein